MRGCEREGRLQTGPRRGLHRGKKRCAEYTDPAVRSFDRTQEIPEFPRGPRHATIDRELGRDLPVPAVKSVPEADHSDQQRRDPEAEGKCEHFRSPRAPRSLRGHRNGHGHGRPTAIPGPPRALPLERSAGPAASRERPRRPRSSTESVANVPRRPKRHPPQERRPRARGARTQSPPGRSPGGGQPDMLTSSFTFFRIC